MEKLNLLNDKQLYQQYLSLVAQRDALQKILDYLQNDDRKPRIETEQYQQELEFVITTLTETKQKLDTIRENNPLLEDLILQQHREQLIAIESSTYADFVQAGLLKEIPSLVIEKVFEA
jgi:CPA1 family monovalent cation:H+ antiporter